MKAEFKPTLLHLKIKFVSHSVLYSHDDINNHNNTGRLWRFWYERVYFFQPSALGDMRRVTQFIRANANHIMLTPSSCAAYLVMSKISTHLYWSRPRLIWSQKLNCPLWRPYLNSFFKSLKFFGHLLRTWRYPPAQFTPFARPVPF